MLNERRAELQQSYWSEQPPSDQKESFNFRYSPKVLFLLAARPGMSGVLRWGTLESTEPERQQTGSAWLLLGLGASTESWTLWPDRCEPKRGLGHFFSKFSSLYKGLKIFFHYFFLFQEAPNLQFEKRKLKQKIEALLQINDTTGRHPAGELKPLFWLIQQHFSRH